MLRLVGGILLAILATPALAGTHWYGNFVNNLNTEVTISKTGSHCWYAEGFDGYPTVKPGDSTPVASEINFGPFFCDLSSDYYLNFQIMDGSTQVATGTLNASCPPFSRCTCSVTGLPSRVQPPAYPCGADGQNRYYTITLSYAQDGSVQAIASWTQTTNSPTQ